MNYYLESNYDSNKYKIRELIINSLDKKLSYDDDSVLDIKMNILLDKLISISSEIINYQNTNQFLSFNQWKDIIEKTIFFNINLLLDDIPDENYHINYDNGMTTDEMVSIIIKNNLYII